MLKIPKTTLKCVKIQLLEIIPSCCTQNDAKSISRENHEQSSNHDRGDDNARNPNQNHNNARDN